MRIFGVFMLRFSFFFNAILLISSLADASEVPTPTNVRIEVFERNKIIFSWDRVGPIQGYIPYRGTQAFGSTTSTGQYDGPLPDGQYCYSVQAYDDSKGGMRSDMSEKACVTIGSPSVAPVPPPTSTTVPTPTGLKIQVFETNKIIFSWDRVGTNLGYVPFRETQAFESTTSTGQYDGPLSDGQHCYSVQAYDDSKGGLRSPMSEKICVTIGSGNSGSVTTTTQPQPPPTGNAGVPTPTGTRVQIFEANKVQFTWDRMGANLGYIPYRATQPFASTTPTGQTDGPLPDGQYCYSVQSYDDSKGGLRSPLSEKICVTIGAATPPQSPTPAPAPTPTPSPSPQPSPIVSSSASNVPFGCRLDDLSCSGPVAPSCGSSVSNWASPTSSGTAPVGYDIYNRTYKSTAGFAVVDRINSLYYGGRASGLTQEKGRSFDGEHVTLYFNEGYPGLARGIPVSQYSNACDDIYQSRVTFGWQSYGLNINWIITAITEKNTKDMVANYYRSGNASAQFTQDFYKGFFENNVVMVQPAVDSFQGDASRNLPENTFSRRWNSSYIDRYTFLSPFYLQSIGFSGSDTELLKPVIFAAASLPPAVKTRIMRQGLLAPTVMTLFKKYIQGDGNLSSAQAHQPAYTLPPEADEGSTSGTPRLDALVDAANRMDHIPPVARIKVLSASIQRAPGSWYLRDAYTADYTYAYFAALRPGETLVLTVDLGQSWRDGTRALSFYSSVLRGQGTIERLDGAGSQLRITIPWNTQTGSSVARTDVLLLANDGSLDSAPAYVSVRHIQSSEFGDFGL